MLPFLADLHLLSHDLIARLLESGNLWLHVVVHSVLLGGPAALAAVLAVPCWHLLQRAWRGLGPLRSRQRVQHASPLPAGLAAYLLHRTWRAQLRLIAGAAASMPVLYATLELPKLIINNAIESGHFPVVYGGIALSQVQLLVVLCLLFLVVVMLSGGLKFWINLGKGRIAEAMVHRLRLTVHREWRRRGRPGGEVQLVPVLVQEVEPVGGIAGDLFALPLFQGGTFLTILVFMIVQDPVLGAAAVTLLPLQIALIPRLQRRINQLGRERVKEIRRLGDLVGSNESGERRSLRLANAAFRRVHRIRVEIYRRKFLIKGLSNFIGHMTPFFFYTIGGYLVIEGALSLGALVAVLTAYKDFSAPLRALFNYYQRLEDVRVRYEELRLFLAGGAEAAGPELALAEGVIPPTASLIRGRG